MISFRNLLMSFCSNTKNNTTWEILLKYKNQICILIKINLNINVKNLKPGYCYELGVFYLFDDCKFNYNPTIKEFLGNNIIPDGKYNDIYVEIKGFRHDMSGTCDEKNIGISWKYYSLSKFNEKLLVILCGKITKINKELLKDNKFKEMYPKFLGYKKFDDF